MRGGGGGGSLSRCHAIQPLAMDVSEIIFFPMGMTELYACNLLKIINEIRGVKIFWPGKG